MAPAGIPPPLRRRAAAEALGTGLLLVAVVGSGISAVRLSPDPGLQLLVNAAATAAALVTIIHAFGPVSGAHVNPAVTLAECLLHHLDGRVAAAYVAAQMAGAAAGAVVANVMFDLSPIAWSSTSRGGAGQWLGEVVATFGLVVVVAALARSGQRRSIPLAVGAYIGGAYFFTSSTSFANPAVTVARILSDTFTGIAPSSVPPFVVAQVAGGLLAVGAVRLLYPVATPAAPAPDQSLEADQR